MMIALGTVEIYYSYRRETFTYNNWCSESHHATDGILSKYFEKVFK